MIDASPCGMVPSGSPARRPVYQELGKVVVAFDELKPSAMLPNESIAMLPIQRWIPSVTPGAYVPCWKIVGVPSGSRTSYQRTPATLAAASTDWFVTSDSWVPKLR